MASFIFFLDFVQHLILHYGVGLNELRVCILSPNIVYFIMVDHYDSMKRGHCKCKIDHSRTNLLKYTIHYIDSICKYFV